MGPFTGSWSQANAAELFILTQPRNYPPDRQGLSKATTPSPWTQTPKAGSPDKPSAHQWSDTAEPLRPKQNHSVTTGRGQRAEAALGEKSLGTDLRDGTDSRSHTWQLPHTPRTNE